MKTINGTGQIRTETCLLYLITKVHNNEKLNLYNLKLPLKVVYNGHEADPVTLMRPHNKKWAVGA